MYKQVILLALLTCYIAAHEQVAIDYYNTGRPELAKELFYKELQNAKTPEQKVQIQYNLGATLVALDQYKEAIQIFDQIEPQLITSSYVRQSVFYNKAFCFLREAELALQMGDKKGELIEENLQQAEAIVPLLDVSLQQVVRNQISYIRLGQKLVALQPEQNNIIDYIRNREKELLSYLEIGSLLPLYIEAIREDMAHIAKEKIEAKTGLELANKIDDLLFIKCLEYSKDKVQKGLELCVEADVLSRGPNNSGFWRERKKARISLLKEYEAPPDRVVRYLKKGKCTEAFEYYNFYKLPLSEQFQMALQEEKPAVALLEALSDALHLHKVLMNHEAVIAAWVKVDKRACILFLLEALKKEVTKKNLQFLEYAGLKNEALQIQREQDKELQRLLIASFEYQYIYKDETLEKMLPFAIDFEKQVLLWKKDAVGFVQETSSQILTRFEKTEYEEEAKSLLLLLQNSGSSNMQFRYVHSKILEFLEKIQKKDQKEEMAERQKVQKNTFTISPKDAMRDLQEMEKNDFMPQEVKKQNTTVERPW